MKKILSLFSTLLFVLNAWSADVFQLENSDFEQWSSSYEPTMWHTYHSAGGSLSSFVKSDNQSSKITSDLRAGTKGSAAIKVNARSVLGVAANGMLTTGQIEGNSSSATDPNNHNISKEGYRSPFTGRPDSVVAWLKTIPKDNTQKARFFFLFHNNSNTQDPGTTWTQVVAIAGTNVAYQSNWQRVATPVLYKKLGESLVIDGWDGKNVISETKTPDCSDERPSFCLASIATNFQAGKGNGSDALYIDDLEMIYNSRLASLSINGSALSGFSKEKYNYNVNSKYSDCTVAYKSDGKFATVEESYDKATSILTITVKGDDYPSSGNAHTYTIQFAQECNPILTDFTINGKSLTGFSSSTFNYTLEEVYADVTVKAIAAECATSKASWDEATQTYTVTVGSGSSVNTYTFRFHASYGSQLKSLTIDGTDVKGFSPSIYAYTVENAYREAGLSYTADADATVEKSFNDQTYVLTLTVKGGDILTNSKNSHTYTIQYHEPYESLLTDLKFYGNKVEKFSPTTSSYNVVYAYNSTDNLSYTASEGASVIPSYNNTTYTLTLTVNGQDIAVNPSNKHVYTIQCHEPYSSQLTALSINGTAIKSFSPNTYSYSTDASYQEGSTEVSYTAAKGAEASTTYNEKTNAYIITVNGGDISWNPTNTHTYSIEFHEAYGSKLSNISINGNTLPEFDPNVFDYQLSMTYTPLIALADDGASMSYNYDPDTYTMTYIVKGADIATNPTNTHTYTIRFHAPYGSYLESLSVNGAPLAGFTKTKTSYEVAANYTEGCVTFEADSEATATSSYDSSKGICTIVVKGGDFANNSSNTHTYKITFLGSYGSQLTSLKVNGTAVSGFSADNYTYALKSAYTDGKTAITYSTDNGATVVGSFDEETNTYTLVVKGADFETDPTNTHTYSIVFHNSYGSQLKELSIAGKTLEEFAPSTYQYTVVNAYDPSILSYIQDEEATVEKTEDAKNYMVTLKVKGGDYLDNNSNIHTYTIQFHAPYASQLTNLSNNGQKVAGFSSNIYKYILNSTYENAQIEFSVSEGASYETNYEASSNQLIITVKGGDFDSNASNYHTYIIEFHDSYGSNLTSLKVNRQSVEGFAPDQYNYAVESLYDDNVTCQADAEASYNMSYNEKTKELTIEVVGGDILSNPTNKHTYTLQFEAPSVLTSLQVDGVSVSNFREGKYSYSMTSTLYEAGKVTYTASEGATVEDDYNEASGLLTLVVKGKDIQTFPSNTHTYTVQFETPHTSYLTDLKINGQTIEGFDKETLNYLVRSAYRDCQVTYTADAGARVNVSFNALSNLLTLTVTATDTHIYQVQFYAPSQLTSAIMNRAILSDFSNQTYEYDLQPYAYEEVKLSLYGDEGATVSTSYDEESYTLTATVYGNDFKEYPDNKHTYQFQFSAPYSSELSSLTVDGKELKQADKQNYAYEAIYKNVAVKATAIDDRATITQMYDANTQQLTIRVNGGNISRMPNNYQEYVIQFNDPVLYGSQLQSLKANGMLISTFSPDVYDYQLEGSYAEQTISYQADKKAIVEERFNVDDNNLELVVKGGDYEKDPTNVHTYTIHFKKDFTFGSLITRLTLNGVEYEEFTSDSFEYTLAGNYQPSDLGITISTLAQYCEYYDANAKSITIIVYGGDFAENTSNFHTYVFKLSK